MSRNGYINQIFKTLQSKKEKFAKIEYKEKNKKLFSSKKAKEIPKSKLLINHSLNKKFNLARKKISKYSTFSVNSSLDKKHTRLYSKKIISPTKKKHYIKSKTLSMFSGRSDLKEDSKKKIFKLDMGSSSTHLKKNDFEVPRLEINNSESIFDKKIVKSNSTIKELKDCEELDLFTLRKSKNDNKEKKALNSDKKAFSFKKKKTKMDFKEKMNKFGFKN